MENILSILAFLACPLMMLFCMKGMFGSKKDCHKENTDAVLKQKMELLEKQNHKLMKEISELKGKNVV